MINIIQCLCGPKRHCIVAAAYPEADFTPEAITKQFQEMVQEAIQAQVVNPWCGLCGGRDWIYEIGRTRFPTMEEAQAALKKAEEAQMMTRAYIDQQKMKARTN